MGTSFSSSSSSFVFLSLVLLLLLLLLVATAEVVEHTFQVQTSRVQRLCNEQEIVTVNGKLPGPTIHAHEGDTVIVHVLNNSPHNISIHWHGIHMMLNNWADGAGYVTQCPILSGNSYAYKFNITEQEGTLWWHAHLSWLRATVYGAIIIYPRVGRQYPFEKPFEEIPILLGEWWNADMDEVSDLFSNENQTAFISDAFTINGEPGDFYQCSSTGTYTLSVKQGRTYLLRIINAGLNNIVMFKIANHKMTVVAIDACYTNPHVTDMVAIAPGQTTDVLLKADQLPNSYYIVSRAYVTYNSSVMYKNTNNATNGILIYEDDTSPLSKTVPILPTLPDVYDVSTIHDFCSNLTGLTTGPFWIQVPQIVDEHMFINVQMGFLPYYEHRRPESHGIMDALVYGNMNNVSFLLPNELSLLEAFFYDVDGIYTTDFPAEPPTKFDYTNPVNQFNEDLIWIGEEATKVKKLRYNTTVEIVLQNTALVTTEYHPIHLHGFDFYIIARGFGNYNPTSDGKRFNFVNPPKRNTVAVPAGGWVVIRFRANNPGVWLMHCHLEFHMSLGLATAFVVENGPTPSTSLPLPPLDYPKCNNFMMNTASETRSI